VEFSSRLHWEQRPNSLSLLIESKRSSGTPVLDLTESNPTRAGLAYESSVILEALADSRALAYDPHPAGAWPAREAVAEYYACRGERIDPEQVVLTAGTSEAYSFLFKLLADPGDNVLVPRPSYPLFDYLGQLESVKVTHYPLLLDRTWSLDLDALREAASRKTRAVAVVSPNNPTGNFLKSAELNVLTTICAKRGLAMIVDEVFSDFVLSAIDTAPTSVVEQALCFTLSGLSKVAGLPQMKLAWIVVSGPRDERRRAIERLELISDTYLSVGTPVECAAAQLLGTRHAFQRQLFARLSDNLRYLEGELVRSPACSLLPVEGGWYAILRLPRTSSEEEWVLTFLERDNVLVQPGYFYDFPFEAHVVVSLLASPAIFQDGIGRMLGRVQSMLARQPLNGEE
jgi:aspartate/methionine/tyrosine aminotransferase